MHIMIHTHKRACAHTQQQQPGIVWRLQPSTGHWWSL